MHRLTMEKKAIFADGSFFCCCVERPSVGNDNQKNKCHVNCLIPLERTFTRLSCRERSDDVVGNAFNCSLFHCFHN